MASVDEDSIVLNNLLTSVTARTCTASWATEVIKLVKENRNVMCVAVDGKMPLETFVVQLRNLSDSFCEDVQKNCTAVLRELVDEESLRLKNADLNSRLGGVISEVTQNTNCSSLRLYLDALEIVASCVQQTWPDSEEILGASLLEVVLHKKFRSASPDSWLEAIHILVNHGAKKTYMDSTGRLALKSLTMHLMEIMPWPSREFRNSYMDVVSLIASPEVLGTVFELLPLVASNILLKPGCAGTVTELLERLLKVCEDSQKFLNPFLYTFVNSGIGIKRIQPCNSAWADLVEYLISKGADIKWRHSVGPITTTCLHSLVNVPLGVENPSDENVEAFRRVLDLLVTPDTMEAVDSCAIGPLQTLRNLKANASSDGHKKLYELAEDKMLAFFSWPQRLYLTVRSTFKDDFQRLFDKNYLNRVVIAVEQCKENAVTLLWEDPNDDKNSALHWFFNVLDILFPYPSQEQKDMYKSLLTHLLIPDLMFVKNLEGHTPLDFLIASATSTLKISDDMDFYEEVVLLVLDSYASRNADQQMFSSALSNLITQYTLITQPAVNVYFNIFERLVEYGAVVSFSVWKKYFMDVDTEISLKFRRVAASHIKPYVQLVKKMVEIVGTEPGKIKESLTFSWGLPHFVDLYVISKSVSTTIGHIQDLIASKGIQCFDDFIILFKRAVKDGAFDKLSAILNKAVPSSWMKRRALHILAMLCDDKVVYEAMETHCKDVVQEQIGSRDLYGCTPCMLAIIHKNMCAAEHLKTGMNDRDLQDNFACTAKDLLLRNEVSWDPSTASVHSKSNRMPKHCDVQYYEDNCTLQEGLKKGMSASKLLLPTEPHGQPEIQSVVEVFFSRMADCIVDRHPWLECKLRMAGSVGEMTKIGRTDEFDIQFVFTAISREVDVLHIGNSNVGNVQLKHGEFLKSLPENICFEQGNLNVHKFGRILHRELIEALTAKSVSELPIRAIKTSNPWLLVWEHSGPKKGLEISIDIVPIIQIEVDVVNKSMRADRAVTAEGVPLKYNPEALRTVQNKIVENARARPLKLFLRWGRPGREHRLVPTIADYERDLIDSMQPEVRSGIKIVKSLLEIAYWVDGAYYSDTDKPITSYMVKNATFWLVKEAIDGKGFLTVIDELKLISKGLPGDLTYNLYQTIQDCATMISNTVLEEFPKSLSLFEEKLNYDHVFNDKGRAEIAGNARTLKVVYDYLAKQEGIDANSEETQHGSLSGKMHKFLAPAMKDDSFWGTVTLTQNEGANASLVDVGEPKEEDYTMQSKIMSGNAPSPNSETRDESSSDDDDALKSNGMCWAFRIVNFIKNQTFEEFGLPIYYSSDAKPDFLINKWNRVSIRNMCDRMLDWLEPLC